MAKRSIATISWTIVDNAYGFVECITLGVCTLLSKDMHFGTKYGQVLMTYVCYLHMYMQYLHSMHLVFLDGKISLLAFPYSSMIDRVMSCIEAFPILSSQIIFIVYMHLLSYLAS